MNYYDKQGNVIDLQAFSKLFENMAYKRVSETEVGRFWVSTVWLGLDHSMGRGPLQIFETMVFDNRKDDEGTDEVCERYATEEEARAGHIKIVQMIQSNVDFIINEEPTLI